AAGDLDVRRRGGATHPLCARGVCRAARAGCRRVRQAGGEAAQGGSDRARLAVRGAHRSRRARRPRAGALPAGGGLMRAELLQLAADLARKREPFVLAMVVRRAPYSSSHAGALALITADVAYPA